MNTFLVTAKKRGFIHGQARVIGDKFEVNEKEFSENWMAKGEHKPKVIDNSKVKRAEDIKIPSLEIPDLMDKPIKKEEVKEAPKKAAKKKTTKAK